MEYIADTFFLKNEKVFVLQNDGYGWYITNNSYYLHFDGTWCFSMWNDIENRHHYHSTKESAIDLAESCGFEVEVIEVI